MKIENTILSIALYFGLRNTAAYDDLVNAALADISNSFVDFPTGGTGSSATFLDDPNCRKRLILSATTKTLILVMLHN